MIYCADMRQVNYWAGTSSAFSSPNLSLASISSGMSASASFQSSWLLTFNLPEAFNELLESGVIPERLPERPELKLTDRAPVRDR